MIHNVVFIGPQGSGKTSILSRRRDSKFNANTSATIGVDVFRYAHGNIDVRLWDCSGNERFADLISSYYYCSVNTCVYCVDLSVRFDSEVAGKEIEKVQATSPDAQIILVGTKSDKENIENTTAKLQEFAKENNYKLFITSAKDDDNKDIAEFFAEIDKQDLNAVKTLWKDTCNKINPQAQLYDALVELQQVCEGLPNKAARNGIALAAHKLVDRLQRPAEDKQLAITLFQNDCKPHLQGCVSSVEKTIKAVAAVVIAAIVTLIATMVGFSVGFSAGLWTGPGAFITGVMAGGAAASAVMGASAAMGVGAGVLGTRGLFKPKAAPEIEAVIKAAKITHAAADVPVGPN